MFLDKNGNPDVTRSQPWSPLPEGRKEEVERFKVVVNQILAGLDVFKKPAMEAAAPEVNRLLALAKTHIELGAMCAVKALTTEA